MALWQCAAAECLNPSGPESRNKPVGSRLNYIPSRPMPLWPLVPARPMSQRFYDLLKQDQMSKHENWWVHTPAPYTATKAFITMTSAHPLFPPAHHHLAIAVWSFIVLVPDSDRGPEALLAMVPRYCTLTHLTELNMW